MIYFIQAGTNGAVKIGFALVPQKRLLALQTGHQETLRLIRSIDGDRDIEQRLHWFFRDSQIRGEWFSFCKEMLTVNPIELPIAPPKTSTDQHKFSEMTIGIEEIKDIRKRLNLSQTEFAETYGLTVHQVRSWEIDRRKPSGATLMLLKLIETNPLTIARMIAEIRDNGD